MESKPLRVYPSAEQEYLSALAWYRDQSLIAAEEFEVAIRYPAFCAMVMVYPSPSSKANSFMP